MDFIIFINRTVPPSFSTMFALGWGLGHVDMKVIRIFPNSDSANGRSRSIFTLLCLLLPKCLMIGLTILDTIEKLDRNHVAA